jgi:hypothetical protein
MPQRACARRMRPMPALLELQRSMRQQLLTQQSPGLDPRHDEVLAIYRNTVASTLVNALRLSFPAVQHLVGADFFEAAAREFIRGNVPASACLNDYGDEFPGFLARFPPAATLPYLADVAQLEWAVNRALHAPDVGKLDLSRLASLEEAALPHVSFTAHPALSLLRLGFGADAIWRAVLDQDSEAMARIDLRTGAVSLLIERDAHGVQVRRMPEWAWQFTASLSCGKPVHAALAGSPAASGEEINALLAEHLVSGRFIDFSRTGEVLP